MIIKQIVSQERHTFLDAWHDSLYRDVVWFNYLDKQLLFRSVYDTLAASEIFPNLVS